MKSLLAPNFATTATLPARASMAGRNRFRRRQLGMVRSVTASGHRVPASTVRKPDQCCSILREKYARGMTGCNRSSEIGGDRGQKNGPHLATAKGRRSGEVGFPFPEN